MLRKTQDTDVDAPRMAIATVNANATRFLPCGPRVRGIEYARNRRPQNDILLSVTQFSNAWLLHRSKAMLPIPGTSSVAHLEQNVASVGVELSDSEWRQIEAKAKPDR